MLVWCGVTRRVSSYLIFGFFDWFGEEWNTSVNKSQKSRAGIPSMRDPASREIISASVEPCETDVCFLHIQLFGTNVWLPSMHKSPPDVDFESSKSPAKSESWNSPNLHCRALFPTWQYYLNSQMWWMCEIKRAKRSLVACAGPLIDCTCKFVHRPLKYQAYQCAPNIRFEKQFVSKPPTFLQQIPFLDPWIWWSSRHGVATL